MKKLLMVLLLLLLVLSACNLPERTPANGDDLIETQVAQELTKIAVTQEALQPSNTPIALVTATLAPTATTAADTTTPEPSPTTEPTATETAAPSPTPPANDPRETLGDPDWRDSFATSQNFGTFDEAETKVEIRDGYMYLTARNANNFHGWTFSYPKIKDFYLEATVKTGECAGNDRYGLVFRAPAFDKGYFFGVTCGGRYDFRIWDPDGFQRLLDYQNAAGFNAGSNASNRIGVMARGSKIGFYVNGGLLGEATNTTFDKEGLFGLFVAASDTPGFTVQVDEVAYWELD